MYQYTCRYIFKSPILIVKLYLKTCLETVKFSFYASKNEMISPFSKMQEKKDWAGKKGKSLLYFQVCEEVSLNFFDKILVFEIIFLRYAIEHFK